MVGLLAAGCSASSHRAASTRGVASTPAHPPGALALDEGARTTGHLVIGTGVGVDRVLQGVGFAFSPYVRHLTAGLIFVHAAAGARATVVWSEESADGEHALFTQQVALPPQGVLYATAVASGRLAEGVFRVHATIGSEQRDTLFVISRLAEIRPGEGGIEGAPVVQGGSSEASPGTLSSGPAEAVDTPSSCEREYTDPDLVRNCNQWYYGTDEAPKPSTEPPVDPSKPCPSDSVPDLVSTQNGGLGGFISMYTTRSSYLCTDTASLTLAAAVNGAAPAVIVHGKGEVAWDGETCGLAGGSDLVGDVVKGARLGGGVEDDLLEREGTRGIRAVSGGRGDTGGRHEGRFR